MVKPEWGTKRTCKACGAKYYDLKKAPAACPRCGAPHQGEAAAKPRRNPPPPPEPAPAAPAKPKKDDTDGGGGNEALPAYESDDESEGGEIIEDASELGEDEDDMADVIESSREDEES